MRNAPPDYLKTISTIEPLGSHRRFSMMGMKNVINTIASLRGEQALTEFRRTRHTILSISFQSYPLPSLDPASLPYGPLHGAILLPAPNFLATNLNPARF
jgi:hypothetical protein